MVKGLTEKQKKNLPEALKKAIMKKRREEAGKKKPQKLRVIKGSDLDKATGGKKKEIDVDKPKKKLKIKKKEGTGNKLPNSKLKCFMRKAKNGGLYRTCATPEKDKQPKRQVRGNPRGQGRGGEKAYASVADRRTAQGNRAKRTRAEKNPRRMPITRADGSVSVVKVRKEGEKRKKKK